MNNAGLVAFLSRKQPTYTHGLLLAYGPDDETRAVGQMKTQQHQREKREGKRPDRAMIIYLEVGA